MKNPSKAGKIDPETQRILSDDTIYRVLDYLYKHEMKFSEVLILNLFALYASVFNNDVAEHVIYDSDNLIKNNIVITCTMEDLQDGDRVIVSWGTYPERKKFRQKYRDRIEEVMGLLENVRLWKVGDITRIDSYEFPQHGLQWVDFEEMTRL